MTPLRDYLLDAYGGFADQRYKDNSLDRPIKVDDQNDYDVHPHFCRMMVRVPDSGDDLLTLSLHHVPITPQVRSLIEERGGTIREIPYGHTAEIPLNLKSTSFLRQLAMTIRRVIGRGKRYDNPDWKWQCPRTASSLERLAQVVKAYNSERRLAGAPRRSSPAASTEKS